jgi:hypothetical protein
VGASALSGIVIRRYWFFFGRQETVWKQAVLGVSPVMEDGVPFLHGTVAHRKSVAKD